MNRTFKNDVQKREVVEGDKIEEAKKKIRKVQSQQFKVTKPKSRGQVAEHAAFLRTWFLRIWKLWRNSIPLGDPCRLRLPSETTSMTPRLLRFIRSFEVLKESVTVARHVRHHHMLIQREQGIFLLSSVAIMVAGGFFRKSIPSAFDEPVQLYSGRLFPFY